MDGHTYMRIEGHSQQLLPGGTFRAGRRWSEIMGFAFGSGTPLYTGSSAGNRPAGDVSSVVIMRMMDAGSANLFRTAGTGADIGTVFLETAEGTGKKEVVRSRIVLRDAMIGNFQYSNLHNVPMESMTLSFSRLEFS